jgi:hypothetical protein
LEMEVAEHDIRAPTTDQLDDAGVDTATEKGHGATGTTRASGDIIGIETKLGAQYSGGGTNGLGDQSGGHRAPGSGRGVADGAQWGIARGSVEAKVADAVDNTNHGTGIEVARPRVADNFATDTIFLGSERESDEGDTVEVSELTSERIKTSVADEELDIAEAKRVAFTRAAIFARAKEPKERHVAQVGHSKADVVAVEGGQLANIVENGKRKRFDARRWGVFLGITAKLTVKAEVKEAGAYLVARVQGPHAGEALADGAEVVLHCSRSYRLAAAGKGSNTDAMGKDLEDANFVRDVREQGVLVEGDTDLGPDGPVFAGGSVAARNDAGLGRFFCKAEITAKVICGLRGQRTQDRCCGYVVLK